jgi:hypothetical protein
VEGGTALRRPADAIVLGFTKAPSLVVRSFAPLRQLKQEGILRNIHYVTWDGADIDPFVVSVLNMPDVQVTRVPQPAVQGTPYQKTIAYQINNLIAALALIRESDTLVLKLRPDFVADVDFLRDKIVKFDIDCEVESDSAPLGVAMPKPVFRSKIWTPWADSNQPFFYEDAAFLGRKDDLCNLETHLSRTDMEMLATPFCDAYYHIVRFAKIFLPSFPMFKAYLQNYRHVTSNMDYRMKMIPHALKSPYFLFLVVAHAWILHSQFHVDCGEPGDLEFYPNLRNKTADWSNPNTWRLAFPYDGVTNWRRTTVPGCFVPSIGRPFGRLLDDEWQKALFTKDVPDLPRATLRGILNNVSQSRDGRLKQMERAFYDDLSAFYRAYMARQASSLSSNPRAGGASAPAAANL